MSIAELRRRIERIEASQVSGAPTKIVADRPMKRGETSAALANWREWVADGRAHARNGVLWITSPRLTAAEWEARYATTH